jgi:hypothetical protein
MFYFFYSIFIYDYFNLLLYQHFLFQNNLLPRDLIIEISKSKKNKKPSLELIRKFSNLFFSSKHNQKPIPNVLQDVDYNTKKNEMINIRK